MGNPDHVVVDALDRGLVATFDELIAAAFRLGRMEGEYPLNAVEHVQEALREVGLKLFSAPVLDLVCEWFGDLLEPTEGTVFHTLLGLYDLGEVGLGEGIRAQLAAVGLRVPAPQGVWWYGGSGA